MQRASAAVNPTRRRRSLSSPHRRLRRYGLPPPRTPPSRPSVLLLRRISFPSWLGFAHPRRRLRPIAKEPPPRLRLRRYELSPPYGPSHSPPQVRSFLDPSLSLGLPHPHRRHCSVVKVPLLPPPPSCRHLRMYGVARLDPDPRRPSSRVARVRLAPFTICLGFIHGRLISS
jgi:hypothetical protein